MLSIDFLKHLIADKLRPHKLNKCSDLLAALMYRSWHSEPKERPTLSLIKKVLRLIYHVLPNNRQEYTEEMENELKRQWTDVHHLPTAYFPCQPRLNNVQSRNIHQDYLKKMKDIIATKDKILNIREQLPKIQEQNEINENRRIRIIEENKQLEDQCALLGIDTNS